MKRYFLIAYSGISQTNKAFSAGSLEVAKDGFPSKAELVNAAEQLNGGVEDVVITHIYEFPAESDFLAFNAA